MVLCEILLSKLIITYIKHYSLVTHQSKKNIYIATIYVPPQQTHSFKLLILFFTKILMLLSPPKKLSPTSLTSLKCSNICGKLIKAIANVFLHHTSTNTL